MLVSRLYGLILAPWPQTVRLKALHPSDDAALTPASSTVGLSRAVTVADFTISVRQVSYHEDFWGATPATIDTALGKYFRELRRLTDAGKVGSVCDEYDIQCEFHSDSMNAIWLRRANGSGLQRAGLFTHTIMRVLVVGMHPTGAKHRNVLPSSTN